jgi:hypothetical protein
MKLLFVLGYRRSGTTILGDQLQTHPDIQYFLGDFVPGNKRRNEFHLFDLADRAPEEYAILFRTYCGRAPSGDVTTDAEEIFAQCARPVGMVRSTRLLMSAPAWQRFRTWAAATRHQVWLLGIVRFPLDTLSSDNRTYGSQAIPDARTKVLATAQEVWAESYRRFLDDTAFAASVRRLRLEDVIAGPAEQFQRVSEWLGLTPFPRLVDWRPYNQGRWRKDPAFAGFTVHPATREIGRRFGYEL